MTATVIIVTGLDLAGLCVIIVLFNCSEDFKTVGVFLLASFGSSWHRLLRRTLQPSKLLRRKPSLMTVISTTRNEEEKSAYR
jgi:hypothetical protein